MEVNKLLRPTKRYTEKGVKHWDQHAFLRKQEPFRRGRKSRSAVLFFFVPNQFYLCGVENRNDDYESFFDNSDKPGGIRILDPPDITVKEYFF